MNDYLFQICFNLDCFDSAYIYFIDYLLLNLQYYRNYEEDELVFVVNLNGIRSTLNIESLTSYWKQHRELIKEQDFVNRIVYTGSYTASYKEDLDDVFKELDTLIKD
ncbi:hypothetical protein D3C75_1092540 [compost metagenome]